MQSNPSGNSILTAELKSLLGLTYKKIILGDEIVVDTHCNIYSLHHLLIHLAEELQGDAELNISTFSMSEEVLNAFMAMREQRLLKSISLCIDKNFATKATPLLFYAGNAIDELYLVSNHTKIAVISKAGNPKFLIACSANLNYNPRWEYYMATSNKYMIQAHIQILEEIKNSGSQWR